MVHRRASLILMAVSLCIGAISFAQSLSQSSPGNEPNLTDEEQKAFLLNAKVVSSKQLGKGITHPWRLTLTDGRITHDAAFQSIEDRSRVREFDNGSREYNFVDSYHYDIAGYEVAKLIGMSDMVPVYVEREWKGQKGALSWWIPWKWDNGMIRQQKLSPPDQNAWNKQMYKIRILDQLLYDTDPNLTNILITEDWKIWRIDFTRAFRLHHDLQAPADLVKCDKNLLERLRALNGDEVMEKTKPHLGKPEVEALMARRDKILAHFDQLIAQKGMENVLY